MILQSSRSGAAATVPAISAEGAAMTSFTLNGRRFKPDPTRLIGAGGEAEVFEIGGGRAVKLFKGPEHPELNGDPQAQEAARLRLTEKGAKLREFPTGLPAEVIVPGSHVFDSWSKKIRGYEMTLVRGAELLLRYGERSFREGRVGASEMVRILRRLHASVGALHRSGIVIGDFNDLNVLVSGEIPYLVDADSFQFGNYRCAVFTERFIDPLLCDCSGGSLSLGGTMSERSDWYAFAVMVIRTLLHVEPYGGVYRPADPAAQLPQGARPAKRITIFHPDVRYPKPAYPLDTLGDTLLGELQAIFVDDRRGEFPLELLDPDEWCACPRCGLEHTRRHCPACAHLSPTAWQRTSTVRGSVECRHVVRTGGIILAATLEHGVLRTLLSSGDALHREDGRSIPLRSPLSGLHATLWGRSTVLSRGPRTILIDGFGTADELDVDCGLAGPLISASNQLVYVSHGTIYRRAAERRNMASDEPIGTIIPRHALLWTDAELGFGLYRASGLTVGFTFNPARGGLNDSARLPWLRGQVLRAQCAFGKDRIWLHMVLSDQGRVGHHLVALDRSGAILGKATVFAGSPCPDGFDSWLTRLGGICGAGSLLLAATDEGLIRIELLPLQSVPGPDRAPGGCNPPEYRLACTKSFPDTAPFVDSGCRLLSTAAGVYVIEGKEIRLLSMR